MIATEHGLPKTEPGMTRREWMRLVNAMAPPMHKLSAPYPWDDPESPFDWDAPV